jgi:beta-xylosidase
VLGAIILWTVVREQRPERAAGRGGVARRRITSDGHTRHSQSDPAGIQPDPSIVRVGDDYYIATSTFEWFPGVQIHHSRDLVHWRLLARPLARASQLDMRGDPDSCGVWAPCLTYDDGRFYLIYTDVKRYGRTSTRAPRARRCATSTTTW